MDIDAGSFHNSHLSDVLHRFAHVRVSAEDLATVVVDQPKAKRTRVRQLHQQPAEELSVVKYDKKYEGYSKPELIDALVAKDEGDNANQKDQHKLMQKNRYLQNKCNTLVQSLGEQKKAHADEIALLQYRDEGKRSCARVGAYRLAISRQHGASAMATVAMMAGNDVQGMLKDKSIVLKHEIYAAVAQTKQKQTQTTAVAQKLIGESCSKSARHNWSTCQRMLQCRPGCRRSCSNAMRRMTELEAVMEIRCMSHLLKHQDWSALPF